MMSCGERGAPPAQVLPGLGDELGGMVLAWAICAALYAREKTGKGQLVDTSLMGSLMCMESLVLSAPAMLGQEFQREIRTEAGNPIYNHYKAKDDKWFILAHLQPDRYWHNACLALGMPELENDSRFNSIENRGTNSKELISILDNRFAAKTRSEWFEEFKKQKLIYAPIQTPTEVVNDPQAVANKYIIWHDHPTLGKTKMVGFPWDFSDTPASVRREAPEFGQHTEEILLEFGYSWDDIIKLKDEKIIP
jgi:crotonobetainyl-CoA:carnitine CoA-transferase CaiB-like acyl-CoA transferase